VVSGRVRIEKVVTSGTFNLDGGSWVVDNNVWIVGDDDEVVVLDAPHDAGAIADAIDDRTVAAIVCTHAHDDHINEAANLASLTDAPVHLHPDDLPLWEQTHPHLAPDETLTEGQRIRVAGLTLHVMHTPGHAPGAVCFYAEDLACVFTGDTLFHGGPGATGRSFSDRPLLITSILDKLMALPGPTIVKTGHGDDTTLAEEKDNLV